MFVSSDGLKERWRMMSSSGHAQSHDEIEMSLSDRVREQIYGGHKVYLQYLPDGEHVLTSGSKNDFRRYVEPSNLARQSSFNGHHSLQGSTRDRAGSSIDVRIDHHHRDHSAQQQQTSEGIRYSGKHAIISGSSPSVGSADWPPVSILSPSENTNQQQCNYPPDATHFDSPGVVGIATRYDVGTTNYLADRFLSASYSSISPPSAENLPGGGLTHHGFSTPPSGGSQFYVEQPLGVVASGLDVGLPRAAVGCLSSGGGGGYPSMTVNLSMSMNVVETPTSARRAWNIVGDDDNGEGDDDVDGESVPDMRWPANYAIHHQYHDSPHSLHHNNSNGHQQHHTGYRCGNTCSPHSGAGSWRLHATPTTAMTCFKRSPASSATDCGGQVITHLMNARQDDGLVYLSSRHEQQHYLATQNQQHAQNQQQQNHHHQQQQQQHHQSRLQTAGLQSFHDDAESGTPAHNFPSGSSPQFPNRRDSVERSAMIAGRQMVARCQQRLFSTGAQSQTASSIHMASAHHHHHQQQQQQQRQGGCRSGDRSGLIRSSQRHNHDARCSMSRDSGATDINGGGRGSVGVASVQVDSLTGRPNVCRICEKTYARPSTLKTHLRTHSGEKPYTCGTCRKAFSQAANLTAHLRTHTGERPFSCPVCSRRFSQSSSVATHLRTHSGERPYRCRLCSKTFSDSSTLTKHLRIHSGEKPYQCSICLLRFSQSGNLNRHKRVHGPA